MRLSCLQENLSSGLGVVGRAVATRSPLPITQNVLIQTDQSRLKLAATNTEIAITTWIGSQIEDEGAITVPARLFTELVNSLPAERIDIESISAGTGISVKCSRVDSNVNGIDAEEFPPIPSIDDGIVGKIEPGVLLDAISRVAFAAATEDSRPVLTGIKVEIEGDNFTFAAADGFRLAVYKGKLAEPLSEDTEFIIPARSLQEISRLVSGSRELVEFTVTSNKSAALFRLADTEIVTQLLQGTFPNYGQLIPESHDNRATMNRGDLSSAARSASIFARDGSGIVRIMVDASPDGGTGKLSISSRAEEVGDHQGDVDANVEGDDAKIAFNSKYLLDVLEVMSESEVALETTTPSSPGVLRPVDNDNYVHVIMPMFVQW